VEEILQLLLDLKDLAQRIKRYGLDDEADAIDGIRLALMQDGIEQLQKVSG
jgi:hypothetical protein